MRIQKLVEVPYPELLAAVGKFIANKKLQEVCVMEFEEGVIVSGSLVYEGRDGTRRTQETYILNSAELSRWLGQAGGKRSFLGR